VTSLFEMAPMTVNGVGLALGGRGPPPSRACQAVSSILVVRTRTVIHQSRPNTSRSFRRTAFTVRDRRPHGSEAFLGQSLRLCPFVAQLFALKSAPSLRCRSRLAGLDPLARPPRTGVDQMDLRQQHTTGRSQCGHETAARRRVPRLADLGSRRRSPATARHNPDT
jgi:hypothetical protein